MRKTWKWGRLMLGLILIAGILPLPAQVIVSAEGTPAHVTKLSTGAEYGLALKNDGTVWAWGDNKNGQLGDGFTGEKSSLPVQIMESGRALTGVKDIAAGYHHSLALKNDGTVWEWGQIDANANEASAPVPVKGLKNIVSIAAGYEYSLALGSDGTVWAWGDNYAGQLGQGGYSSTTGEPAQVITVEDVLLEDVIAIAAGDSHSMALVSDGSIWTWGLNVNGQLGDGSSQTRAKAGQISGPSEGFTRIAAGAQHSLALKDGVVWAWGLNQAGEVGDGTTINVYTPVKVTSDTDNFTGISAGSYHSLAVKGDGTAWAWGFNYMGQLGDGTTEDRLAPVQVQGFSEASAVSGGQYYSMALMKDGTVWAWGRDESGQLAAGREYIYTTPVRTSVTDAVYVSAGGDYLPHNLVVKDDGTVFAWGQNDFGQLGDGTDVSRETPVQVNIQGVQNVSAGMNHGLALKQDGTIWAWGNGYSGQLGNGTSLPSWEPVPVTVTQGVYTAVSAGRMHSLALRQDGTVWAWGNNMIGQLGIGTTEDHNLPVQVSNLSDIIAISAADSFNLALNSDGAVWGWGNLTMNVAMDLLPVRIPDPGDPSGYLSDVVAIDAGPTHGIALKEDGTVVEWGILDMSMSYQFREVTAASTQAFISAGQGFSLLQDQGQVQSWGANVYGMLGNGHVSGMDNPFEPIGYVIDKNGEKVSGIAKVSAGMSNVLAIKEDGTVWAWGDNGLEVQVNTPVRSPYFAAASPDSSNPGPTDPGAGEPGTTNPGSGSPGSSSPGTSGSGTSSPVSSSTVPKVDTFTLQAGSAGTWQVDDEIEIIIIPTGATDEELRLTVQKVVNTTGLIDSSSTLLTDVYELLKNFEQSFNKPITLSFRFDVSRLQAGQKASVFYYDETAKQWMEVGGSVKGDRITVEVDHFTKFAVFALDDKLGSEFPIVLTDITGHWAEGSIREAIQSGIVNGFPDGTFKPNSPVTRAEFTVMLMNALKPGDEGSELNYSDQNSIGAWARKAVAQASTAGIVNGYSDGRFHPNDQITRAQMASMIAGTLNSGLLEPGADVAPAADLVVSSFTDDRDIPIWAAEAVKAVQAQGIMTGRGQGRFAPLDSATRAEAVTVILKLITSNVSVSD